MFRCICVYYGMIDSMGFCCMNGAISDNVIIQGLLLLASFGAGLVVMLVYDLFRAIRRIDVLKKRQQYKATLKKYKAASDTQPRCVIPEETFQNRLWVHVEDFLFWVCYMVVTYWVIYTYNQGIFSLYVLLGELVGICIYHKVFHNWIRCLYTCILWQIYTIIMWIFHFILLVFCGICEKVRKVLKILIKYLRMVSINN